MRRIGTLVPLGAVVVCALALSSCDDEEGSAEDGRPTASASAEGYSDFLATTVDRGVGKRAVLAFAPTAGDRSTTTFDITVEVAVDDHAPVKVPLTVVRTTEVLDVGDLLSTVRTRIESVEVDRSRTTPEVARGMEAQFSGAEGAVITRRLTASGEPLDADYPSERPAQMKGLQALDSFPGLPMQTARLSFPAEAVGVGARWRVVISKEESTRPADTVVTYRLEELDGDDFRISYRMTGDYPPEVYGSFDGSGEIRGSLTSFAPTSLVGDYQGEDEEEIDGTAVHVASQAHFEVTTTSR